MFRLASFTTRQLNGIGVKLPSLPNLVATGPGLTTFTVTDGVYYGSWYDQGGNQSGYMNFGFLSSNPSYTTISTTLKNMLPGDTFVVSDGPHMTTLTLWYDQFNSYNYGRFSSQDYGSFVDWSAPVNESNTNYNGGIGWFAGTISSIAIPVDNTGRKILKSLMGSVYAAPVGTVMSVDIGPSNGPPGPGGPTYVLRIAVVGTNDENTDVYNMYSGTIEIRTSEANHWSVLTVTGQDASIKNTMNPPFSTFYSIKVQETLNPYGAFGMVTVYGIRYTPGTNGTHPSTGGGGGTGTPVTANLSTMPYPTGFYSSMQGSYYFSPGMTSGTFIFTNPTDAAAIVAANPTSITFNDPFSNTTWLLTGVSGITSSGPIDATANWSLVSSTGMSTSGTPSLTYTGGSGSSAPSWYSVADSTNGSTILTVPSGADVSMSNNAMVKLFTGGQDMYNPSGAMPSGMWQNSYMMTPFNAYRYQDSNITPPITIPNTGTQGLYFAIAPIRGNWPEMGDVEYIPMQQYGTSVNLNQGLQFISGPGQNREAHGVTVIPSYASATAVNCTIHETKTGGPFKYVFWSMDNTQTMAVTNYQDMLTIDQPVSHYTYYWTKFTM